MRPDILLTHYEDAQQQEDHAVQEWQDNAYHAEGYQAPARQLAFQGRAKVYHWVVDGRSVTNLQEILGGLASQCRRAKSAYSLLPYPV